MTFVILPIFALANAGVTLHGSLVGPLTEPIGLGVTGGSYGGFMTSWIIGRNNFV